MAVQGPCRSGHRHRADPPGLCRFQRRRRPEIGAGERSAHVAGGSDSTVVHREASRTGGKKLMRLTRRTFAALASMRVGAWAASAEEFTQEDILLGGQGTYFAYRTPSLTV